MIAHLDLDQFFAACEIARRPELSEVPFVVGGDPNGRGVVATASYPARRYGIGSAMSCAEARRRCPDLTFLSVDMGHYRTVSRSIWAALADAVPALERTGIDEGYLALPDGRDPLLVAAALQAQVRDAAGVTCSLGIASVKVVAKIACDVRKPAGVTLVPAGEEAAFLAALDVARLPGVGPRSAARLVAAGCRRIGDLAAMEDDALARALPGAVGREMRRRARGVDPRPIVTDPVEPVSISREETYARDVRRFSDLEREIDAMAEEVARHLAERARAARTVSVKLRYSRDFRTVTRAHTLPAPTQDAGLIAGLARALARQALADRPGHLRLIGVGVSGLRAEWQLPLPAT